MGFLKDLAALTPIGLISNLARDKDDKPETIQQKAQDTAQTPEQIEQKKRQRRVAANAGTSTAFNPLGQDQNVTSKSLLGL